MKRWLLIAAIGFGLAGASAAQTCLVCVGDSAGGAAADASGPGAEGGGGIVEQGELEATLTGLGFNYIVSADPSQEACQVALSYAGCGSCFGAPPIGWVQAGNGYVQLSDWGPGFQSNTWYSIPENSTIDVQVIDAGHPITQGLPANWVTYGFWKYGFDSEDYVGYTTDGSANLAQADGNPGGLAARSEGAGLLAYIGWNVYGSFATSEDLTVLRQAIEWAGQCAVPVELQSFDVE
jgi:hypothetical protein